MFGLRGAGVCAVQQVVHGDQNHGRLEINFLVDHNRVGGGDRLAAVDGDGDDGVHGHVGVWVDVRAGVLAVHPLPGRQQRAQMGGVFIFFSFFLFSFSSVYPCVPCNAHP